MEAHILVVDDDGQLTSFLKRFLDKQGFQTDIAATAAKARARLAENNYALVVLDLILPDADGLDIAREIGSTSQTPVIMLTARDDVYDRVVGLEIGADDYVTKPYEPRELLARIRSVLRRSTAGQKVALAPKPTNIRFMGFELNPAERLLVNVDKSEPVPLTGTEFTLLHTLASNAGAVLSRAAIMDALYGNNITVTDRAIDAHVARLRKKIDPVDGRNSLIRAVHGQGYVFATELDNPGRGDPR
ncbi:response regulator [Roseobacter weihaiensis]|uniref:response regulator n=1 Tax=Roseobacter weihaiensis TaxID=2763262 RepID=UPI001D0B0739|nr:response regulator transcription factor [Roseobacter sp. H9]